jgi:hypothetical protein
VRFHLPSFLFGCVVGAGASRLAPQIRPLLVEIGATGYRFVDAVRARAARRREDLADLVAEARAQARGWRRGKSESESASESEAEPASTLAAETDLRYS